MKRHIIGTCYQTETIEERGFNRMAFGCSSFTWKTEDHKHLFGRTYDFDTLEESSKALVLPRQYPIFTRQDGGAARPAKYASAGIGLLGLKTPMLYDGVNECGLMGGMLFYPGYASFKDAPCPGTEAVNPGFLPSVLLSFCSCIGEIPELLQSLTLTDERLYGESLTVHYMFSDKSGEAMIVEPDKEGLNIYRNTIGVLTNSPGYPWHLQNLRNYISVSDTPARPKNFLGQELFPFGEGTGGIGLPGDYSPPARFVRTAFAKQYALQGQDEIDGVARMFRGFAMVEVPHGIVKTKRGHAEQTFYLSAMCAESHTYYFTTAVNRRIQAIRLEKEKNRTDLKTFDLPGLQDINYLN